MALYAAPTTNGTGATQSSPFSHVTLVSGDGYECVIPREVALRSGTMKSTLDDTSAFQEARTGVITFPHVRGTILEKVCEFLMHKHRYTVRPSVTMPDFTERIPPELALEILMTADYLNV